MFQELSKAPYLDRVVGLHLNASDNHLGLLIYIEGDIDAFRNQIQQKPEVLDFEIMVTDDGCFYTYFQTELNEVSKQLFATLTRGSLLMVPPYNYGDGSVTISLFGPTDEVQEAVAKVPAPFEVTINEVSGMEATPGLTEPLLSDRQHDALEAAKDIGYYDLPRQGTYEDIAARIGCAPSTAAEHLRKAESKIIRANRR
ncbi:helix-turn-helix domain-containing protein [Natrialba sp. PRR66]|uniref:helix-turn-helix domain-containing protein n=1 Tax=Natrialba sp. PRR66 TaxID=3098146 RepID=UPI002B1E5BBD|nr:helix-turn-helix domain-containing protein [Natrialba sp. PRR66]